MVLFDIFFFIFMAVFFTLIIVGMATLGFWWIDQMLFDWIFWKALHNKCKKRAENKMNKE